MRKTSRGENQNGTTQHLTESRLLLAILIFFHSLFVAEAIDLEEPGRVFKQYQQDRPPIKHIVFEHSCLTKLGLGFAVADGALQPSGYFLRYLTNSPTTSNLVIWGASTQYEWNYSMDWNSVAYGPRKLATNLNLAMNYHHLLDLATVSYLGLPRPFLDGLTWTSQTEFEFANPLGEYIGRITKFENNRPLEVEYESRNEDSKNWRKCRISYEYERQVDFPPKRFLVAVETRDSHLTVTNVLHALEVGLDDIATNGYHLTNFIPKNAELAHIYFMSNQVRFSVRPNGDLVKYKYSDDFERRSQPVRYSIIFVFLVLLVATLTFLVRRRGS